MSKLLQLHNITAVSTQTAVGEAMSSTPCLVHWAGWVANPANTGTVLWGFAPDKCVFPVDWSLPHVPGARYDLSKIFFKTSVSGEGVIVCAAGG